MNTSPPKWKLEQFRTCAPVGQKRCAKCTGWMLSVERHTFCQKCRKAGGYIETRGGPRKAINGSHVPWSQDEIDRLKAMYIRGYSTAHIAKTLGRTSASVKNYVARSKRHE